MPKFYLSVTWVSNVGEYHKIIQDIHGVRELLKKNRLNSVLIRMQSKLEEDARRFHNTFSAGAMNSLQEIIQLKESLKVASENMPSPYAGISKRYCRYDIFDEKGDILVENGEFKYNYEANPLFK